MQEHKKKIPSFDKNRQVLGKIFPLNTPFTVIVDASEVCPFKCNYCFRSNQDKKNWGYANKNNLMKWETFCKAIEQIQEFPQDVKQISLSNHGEPLCNRKLPDMVRYIKQNHVGGRVSIHTNAALLDEKYAVELAESKIDRVIVSLQGLTAEKYKEVCGFHIDYDVFYRNLKTLYEAKADTQICIKIANTALEEGEEEQFYELFEPIADRVFVEQIIPIWLNIEVKDNFMRMKNKYGDVFPIQECCPLIFHTIVVAPDGDVYPCTQLLRKEILGNVKETTLLELWTGAQRKELLLRQCNLDNPPICAECYIRQNSIYSENDLIDEYRYQIKERLNQ